MSGNEDDFFRQLEVDMGWDELPPGTVVEYNGPMEGCRGHRADIVRVTTP